MRRSAAWFPLAVAALVACEPAGQAAAGDTAAAFQTAVSGGDPRTACALLADEARSSLEAATTRPCPEALAALALPGGAVRTVAVWGDGAQARLDAGVLFLARYRAGWRVTAAGCEPRPTGPYDCPVEA